MSLGSYKPDYQQSLEDEPGASFDARQFKVTTLRESKKPVELDDEPAFDDTFKLSGINVRRLREHVSPGEDSFTGQGAHAQPTGGNSQGAFARGVPTNNAPSSKNYGPDHVRIIKGEHVSLLKNGALNEAMEDDDHKQHILEHRYMLSDPKLTETQRSSLLEHIAMHAKLLKKGNKKIQEDTEERAKRRFGPGVAARVLARNGGSDSKIPQDSGVDAERKRTSGMVSMEAGTSRSRAGRAGRFEAALKVRRGLH
jgi:hypothetical protein